MDNYNDKHVWIIGASSGIGRSLACELDKRGATLLLSARNSAKLKTLNNELQGKHTVYPLDVSEYQHVVDTVAEINQTQPPIDSIIFMAAVYQPMRLDQLDIKHLDQQVRINFNAAFYLVDAVLPILKQQQYGQIAFCASVAGYRGLPGGQPYSATKAALINLAETLKSEVIGTAIDVRLICPGFVRTPMTDKNNFKMPFIIEPEQAACAIADGLIKNAFEIHFPKTFTWIMKLLRMIPDKLYFLIAKQL